MSSNEYMRKYVLRRYRERRASALRYLGGVCVRCGAKESLELDHINPKTKSFSVGKMWSVSADRYWSEIEKCQLLCFSCHIDKSIVDAGFQSAKTMHGTLSSYRYCRCDLCRQAKSTYAREYRLRNVP